MKQATNVPLQGVIPAFVWSDYGNLISEVPTFNKCSLITAYSVCLFVLTTVMSFFTFRHILSALLAGEQDFFSTIFYSMMLLLLLIPICSPILAWLDLSKFIQYMGKWIKFQVSKMFIYKLSLLITAQQSLLLLHIFTLRLPVVSIIRESPFTDLCSLYDVKEW